MHSTLAAASPCLSRVRVAASNLAAYTSGNASRSSLGYKCTLATRSSVGGRQPCLTYANSDFNLGITTPDEIDKLEVSSNYVPMATPSEENAISLDDLLDQMRDESDGEGDFIFFEDDDINETDPILQHLNSKNLEPEIHAEDGTILNPRSITDEDALAAATLDDDFEARDIVSAYSSEQGFKEVSVEDLSDHLYNECSECSVVDLNAELSSCECSLVVDVRDPQSFSLGHVPGAVNVPLPELSAAYKSGTFPAEKDEKIAVICQSGQLSKQATVRLTKVFGFQDVTNVAGGTSAWIKAGFDVQSSPPPSEGCGTGCGCH